MDVKEIPALGRPFKLGMLYDYRTHKLVKDPIIWDEKTIDSQTISQPQPLCDFEFTADDTLSAKTSFLNVKGDLKLSLLWGWVEVNGSAKYLDDHRKYTRQSRVSAKYRRRTTFKELQIKEIMSDLQKHHIELESTNATHVVTGIMYGIDTIFVFDRTSTDEKDQQKIHKELSKIVTGHHSNTSYQLDRVKTTFFSDVELKCKLDSFGEAIKVYKKLPTIIEQKVNQSVPMIVWLYPLNKITRKKLTLHRSFDESLVSFIQDRFEEFKVIKMKCNDLLVSPTCRYDRAYKKLVVNMLATIGKSELKLKKELSSNMSHVIPIQLVRELLDDFDKLPESPRNLDKKILEIKAIINVLNFCVSKIKSKTVSNEDDDEDDDGDDGDEDDDTKGQFKLPAIEEFTDPNIDNSCTATEGRQHILRKNILGMRKSMQKKIDNFISELEIKEKSLTVQAHVQHVDDNEPLIAVAPCTLSIIHIDKHTINEIGSQEVLYFLKLLNLCHYDSRTLQNPLKMLLRGYLRSRKPLELSGMLKERTRQYIPFIEQTDISIVFKQGIVSVILTHNETTNEIEFRNPLHFLQILYGMEPFYNERANIPLTIQQSETDFKLQVERKYIKVREEDSKDADPIEKEQCGYENVLDVQKKRDEKNEKPAGT